MEKFDQAQGNKRSSLSTSNAITAPVSLGRHDVEQGSRGDDFLLDHQDHGHHGRRDCRRLSERKLGTRLNEHDLYYGCPVARRAVLSIQIEEVRTRDLLARGRADQCCRHTYYRQSQWTTLGLHWKRPRSSLVSRCWLPLRLGMRVRKHCLFTRSIQPNGKRSTGWPSCSPSL